jgi:signal transduction histidine kinase
MNNTPSDQELLLKQANEAIYKQNFDLSIKNKTLSILHTLYSITISSLDVEDITQKIVDIIVKDLNLTAALISLIDPDRKYTYPVAITKNTQILQAVSKIGKPLSDIKVPLDFSGNLINTAIHSNTRLITSSLQDILTPATTLEVAHEIEQFINIKTLVIYPLTVGQKSLGTLTIGLSKKVDDLSRAEKETIDQIIDLVSIAIDRAQLHEAIEKANEKLKLLDKAKDDFVSLASHELRTPMTAIKSYTWMVLNNKAGSIETKAKEYLDRVLVSTERLIHLVNELLDVSRIESGRIQLKSDQFNLRDLFTDIQNEFLAKQSELQLSLVVEVPSDISAITADREKIHQVLENLIGNAFKFTPTNGKVTLSAKEVPSYVEISITDTGPGISPEDLPKLFQKFGRLENSLIATNGPSTGLGLFICKQYVELHKGKIWVTSKLGLGTTFTFTLPLV